MGRKLRKPKDKISLYFYKNSATILGMKLKDLIKQLNDIKKVHGGDISCDLINCVTGNFSGIDSLNLVYPTGANGAYDRSKPPVGIWVGDHKS
jgi:hypothetical protein